jgi:hypothetical protein
MQIEREYGSFQKDVWQCFCSDSCVKVRYRTTFRKRVWQECLKRKECVAVITVQKKNGTCRNVDVEADSSGTIRFKSDEELTFVAFVV